MESSLTEVVPTHKPGLLRRIVVRPGGKVLVALVLVVYGGILARTAWVCDDAYITFRTIHNFVSGYGLTWNVGERVQVYTHPLWMLLLSAGRYFTGDIYYTAVFSSMVLSVAAAGILAFGVARTTMQALLGLVILVFSKAFVDYSTSGLENPLNHLLLAAFLWLYPGEGRRARGEGRDRETSPLRSPECREGRRGEAAATATATDTSSSAPSPLHPVHLVHPFSTLLKLSLLAGLVALNRMDLLLLVAPPLALAFWPRRSVKAAGLVAIGFLPFVAWEVFSVIYYGFPFPNTAYAKLSTGIPAIDLLRQGMHYFANSLRVDPVTLPAIAAGIVAAVWRRPWQIALAVGIVLYLLYTLKIGGDFMSGRFFSVPLLVAVAILTTVRLPRGKLAVLAGALAIVTTILVGLYGPRPNLWSDSSYGKDGKNLMWTHGVADERAVYYSSTGLLRGSSDLGTPDHASLNEAMRTVGLGKRTVVSKLSMGIFGYYTGPKVYIVDVLALPDPLLARLPISQDAPWRIGHFYRFQPDAYFESLRTGVNQLTDLRLREYYDRIREITTGPIFRWQRWKAIVGINLGRYQHLIDTDYFLHPPLQVSVSRQRSGQDIPLTLDLALPPAGVWITLDRPHRARSVTVTLEGGQGCVVLFPQGVTPPAEQTVQPAEGTAARTVPVPEAVGPAGLDRFLIRPLNKQAPCRVGQVWIVAAPAEPIRQRGHPSEGSELH